MDDNDKFQKVEENAPRLEYCDVCSKREHRSVKTKQYLSITSHGKFLTCNTCGNVRKVEEKT